jgi:ribonuclease HI
VSGGIPEMNGRWIILYYIKYDDSIVHRNLSERCPGVQTSTRAEILAVVRLLEEAPMIGKTGRLVIRTDSMAILNCVKKGPGWETSGKKVKDIVGNKYF